MWHDVDWEQVDRDSWGSIAPGHEEIEQYVVFKRLELYNAGHPCGATALRQHMLDRGVTPLPSRRKIARILTANGLTHGRTGWYQGDSLSLSPRGESR